MLAGTVLGVVARASDNVPQRGENVVLTFNPREAHRFDPETGQRIEA